MSNDGLKERSGSSSPVAERMRLYRERRRQGIHCVRIPLHVTGHRVAAWGQYRPSLLIGLQLEKLDCIQDVVERLCFSALNLARSTSDRLLGGGSSRSRA